MKRCIFAQIQAKDCARTNSSELFWVSFFSFIMKTYYIFRKRHIRYGICEHKTNEKRKQPCHHDLSNATKPKYDKINIPYKISHDENVHQINAKTTVAECHQKVVPALFFHQPIIHFIAYQLD